MKYFLEINTRMERPFSANLSCFYESMYYAEIRRFTNMLTEAAKDA
jgi:hypothetical protein